MKESLNNKNELEHFLNIITTENSFCLLDNKIQDYCVKFLESCVFKPFNKPDFYLENKNEIWLVEHFEVDSNNVTKRNGSVGKLDQNIRDEKFERYSKSKLENGEKYIHSISQINLENSIEFYIKNLKRSFKKHYNKIDSYFSHFIHEIGNPFNKKLKMVFYIEDTSPLGTIIIYDGDPMPLEIFRIHEVFQLFKASDLIDGIFISNYYDKNYMFYIDKAILKLERIEFYDMEKVEYVQLKPIESRFVTVIDNN